MNRESSYSEFDLAHATMKCHALYSDPHKQQEAGTKQARYS
jgi:hypothetical protein